MTQEEVKACADAIERAERVIHGLFAERDQLKAENEALRKYGEEFAVLANRRREEVKALREVMDGLLELYDTDDGCRDLPQYIAGRAAMDKGEQS